MIVIFCDWWLKLGRHREMDLQTSSVLHAHDRDTSMAVLLWHLQQSTTMLNIRIVD
jgi:hypothetical protein